MRFDVVMSFDINPKEGLRILQEEMKRDYLEYEVQILPDVDISDWKIRMSVSWSLRKDNVAEV